MSYNRYYIKDASGYAPYAVDSDVYSTAQYGEIFTVDYPLTASITVDLAVNPNDLTISQYDIADPYRRKLLALKATLKKYEKYSKYFSNVDGIVNYDTDSILIVNIPSIFYGSRIQKSSVKLTTYYDGCLIATLEDSKRDGVLYQTSGVSLANEDNAAGVVLYDDGIILLFDQTALSSDVDNYFSTDSNGQVSPDNPRWISWGLSANAPVGIVTRTSYDIAFQGEQSIPQITMFAEAPKGDLNHSNNPTYIQKNERQKTAKFSNNFYVEDNTVEIKNITKQVYSTPDETFKKETYITKIIIYDEYKLPIGIAKLATPVRKTEERDFTFKLKLDI